MTRSTGVSVGDVIGGRYRIEAVLGQGGMAMVYRARNTGTGKAFAVKVIHAHLAERHGVLELFTKESRVGETLGSHPNIVEVFDAGIDDQSRLPFLAMELLLGETLQQRIERAGAIERSLAATLLTQVGDALDQAHEAHVVHRDLKPSNLFLVEDRKGRTTLKILDFGIAKVLEGDLHLTATEIGTPAYAAPEQLGPTFRKLARKQGVMVAEQVSAATDIWALGLIAYEMITGSPSGHYWGATSAGDLALRMSAALRDRDPASQQAGERALHLPPGFDSWFARCLEIDASLRWPSAGEAVRDLVAKLDSLAGPGPPGKAPPGIAETSLDGILEPFVPAPGPALRPEPIPRAPAPIEPPPRKPRPEPVEPVARKPEPKPVEPPAAITTTAGTTGSRGESAEQAAPSGKKEISPLRWIFAGSLALGLGALALTWSQGGGTPAGSSVLPSPPGSLTPLNRTPPSSQPSGMDAPRARPPVLDMVKVPSGSFLMGEQASAPTSVWPAFEIGRTEVTVAEFGKCVQAGACQGSSTVDWTGITDRERATLSELCNWGKSARDTHPMNCVDAAQATAFCEWAGGRLPTEAEWEYAARGADDRVFPWGKDAPGSNLCWKRGDSRAGTCPVASHPEGKSPFGLEDMAGNVWEVTLTLFCHPSDKACKGDAIVGKGGSWNHEFDSLVKATGRIKAEKNRRGVDAGFRCAR